jgi:hypothetical protein
MKTIATMLLSLSLFFAGSAAVQAQDPNMRPTISPWTNLNRFGQSPALNYYNLVKPQFDFRAGIGQLQQQNQVDQQALSNLQNGNATLVTGHQAGFMTQNSYFQTIRSGSTGGAGVNGNRAATTRRN